MILYEKPIHQPLIFCIQLTIIIFKMEQINKTLIPYGQLKCPNGKDSVFICANENCKQNAFICKNQSCACTQNQHDECNLLKIQNIIKNIERQKKQITRQNKDAFDVILKIYEEMIQKISKDKEEFIDFIDMFGLKENMRKFVGLIRDGRIQEVVGGLVQSVYAEIKEQRLYQEKLQLNTRTVRQFWLEKSKELDKILMKLKIFRDMSRIEIDSNIIDYDGLAKVRFFMHKKIKGFQLLYRGSKNQFSAQKFHQKCQGIEDIMILVETQFGKVIGGFTPVKWQWQSPKLQPFKADPSGQSFLFSVSLNEKYPLINKKKALKQQRDHGPTFGGFDLFLSNQCNINNDSYSYFPDSYNNGNYQRSQASYTAFSGKTDGYHFRVKQYEVFKVIWK